MCNLNTAAICIFYVLIPVTGVERDVSLLRIKKPNENAPREVDVRRTVQGPAPVLDRDPAVHELIKQCMYDGDDFVYTRYRGFSKERGLQSAALVETPIMSPDAVGPRLKRRSRSKLERGGKGGPLSRHLYKKRGLRAVKGRSIGVNTVNRPHLETMQTTEYYPTYGGTSAQLEPSESSHSAANLLKEHAFSSSFGITLPRFPSFKDGFSVNSEPKGHLFIPPIFTQSMVESGDAVNDSKSRRNRKARVAERIAEHKHRKQQDSSEGPQRPLSFEEMDRIIQEAAKETLREEKAASLVEFHPVHAPNTSHIAVGVVATETKYLPCNAVNLAHFKNSYLYATGGGYSEGDFLIAFKDLSRRFPQADWFFLSDEDTYIFHQRLVSFVNNIAKKKGKQTPVIIGNTGCGSLQCRGGKLESGWAQGGSGVIINKALVDKVDWDDCLKHYSSDRRHHFPDHALNCCIMDSWPGIRVHHHKGLMKQAKLEGKTCGEQIDLDGDVEAISKHTEVVSIHGVSHKKLGVLARDGVIREHMIKDPVKLLNTHIRWLPKQNI